MKKTIKHAVLGLALVSSSTMLSQEWLPLSSGPTIDVYRSGKIGIGTTVAPPSPGAQLQVSSTDAFGGVVGNNIMLYSFSGTGGSSGGSITQKNWLLRKTTGTSISSAVMHDGLDIGGATGTPGTNTRTWWERDPNTDIQKWGNGTTTHMELNSGNLYIGTQRPAGLATGAKMSVDGTILSKGLRVADAINIYWADFVFEKDYKLMPLAEVEKYITANKHLPEVPSEAEVKKNGVDILEMNVKLLQKVEELYLHSIELKKQLDLQQQQINDLKNK